MRGLFPAFLACAAAGWGLVTQALAMPTVSIPDFKNEVANVPWWSASVSSQLADALANELAATGGIQVVERQNLKAVLSEQELVELGIVQSTEDETGQKKMTGAQYIVLGRVNAYEAGVETSQEGRSSSFLGFGGSKTVSEDKAYIAIDLRVVDSETGQVVGFRTVEGKAKDTATVQTRERSLAPLSGLVGGVTGATGTGSAVLDAAGTFSSSESSVEEKKTPVAKAIRAALIEASNYVDCILVRQDQCVEEYASKDDARRERTLDVLELD